MRLARVRLVGALGWAVGAVCIGCVADAGPGEAPITFDGGVSQDACEVPCVNADAGTDATTDTAVVAPDAGTDSAVADAGVDAAVGVDAGPVCPPRYASNSRCSVSADMAECPYEERMIGGRRVFSQRPLGSPPERGWPAVVIYQGSGYAPDVTWSGDSTLAHGGLYQVKLQAMLLDNGFVVIAPFADGVAWNTNFPGYSVSSDSRFIPALLDAIDEGTFGTVDTTRLYATGISSGGYMTSRMAVSYPGRFRALAIQSGSYATCTNVACVIPSMLPTDHPPTLFLHGRNDLIVPLVTARAYKDRLDAQGIETELIVDPDVGHDWLSVAPEEITCWFLTH